MIQTGTNDLKEKRLHTAFHKIKLAVAAGITRQYLGKIESGNAAPRRENQGKPAKCSGTVQSRNTAYHAVWITCGYAFPHRREICG